MKRNITNKDCINSTRLLTSFSPDSESANNIVNGVVRSHKLTTEFINEFRGEITKEAFSKSPFLDEHITEMFLDLFDLEAYKTAILDEKVPADIGMIIKYLDSIKDNESIESLIINSINNSTQSEIESADVAQLISIFGDNVDKVLLRKVKDETVKDALMLAIQLKGSDGASSAALKYLSNNDKEELLGTTNIDPKLFIKTLSQSNDLGWILKMLNNAETGEISLVKTRETFDSDLVKFIANIPESTVVKVIKLREYMPNAVSYKVLSWSLVNKDFSEDDLIEVKDTFKAAGLFFELKKFAKQKEYNRLLNNL